MWRIDYTLCDKDRTILSEILENPYTIGHQRLSGLAVDTTFSGIITEYCYYRIAEINIDVIVYHRNRFLEICLPDGHYDLKRMISTISTIIMNIVADGRCINVMGRISNGEIESFRKLGTILAKKYEIDLNGYCRYSKNPYTPYEDHIEFLLTKMVGPTTASIRDKRRRMPTFENNYYIHESVYCGHDELSTAVNKIGENRQ